MCKDVDLEEMTIVRMGIVIGLMCPREHYTRNNITQETTCETMRSHIRPPYSSVQSPHNSPKSHNPKQHTAIPTQTAHASYTAGRLL